MTGKIHELKIWPSGFEAILAGEQTFEYRRNDRDFAVGDVVVLTEWDPANHRHRSSIGGLTVYGGYTGRQIRARISYKLEGTFGVPPGYAVLALRDVEVVP